LSLLKSNSTKMDERIGEMLYDDHQIVTYKSLCINLDISATKAKRALEEYIKKSDDEKTSVVYLLSGRTESGVSIILVRDSELEQAKLKLSTIHQCHPYSVQKQRLSTPQVLYTHDYDLMKNNVQLPSRCSSIKYLGGSVISSTPSQPASKSEDFDDPNKNLFAEKTVKKATNQKDFFKKSSSKDEKKSTVSKATKKSETAVKKEESSSKSDSKPSKKNDAITAKKQGGMKAFMTSGKSNPFESMKKKSPGSKVGSPGSDTSNKTLMNKKKPISETENERQLDEDLALLAAAEDDDFEETCQKKKESPRKSSKDTMSLAVTPSKEEAPSKVLKNTESPSSGKENVPSDDKQSEKSKEKSSAKQKLKKKSRSNSQDLPAAKKRKRIKVMASSSDESDEGEMNVDPPQEVEQDLILASPPQEKRPIKTTSTTSNKRKKRVLKSRTYVDEEGCMLTEKTWEEVSCSSEDEVAVKSRDKNVIAGTPKAELKAKPANKSSVALAKKATKTKQSSLMGFFSKKPVKK